MTYYRAESEEQIIALHGQLEGRCEIAADDDEDTAPYKTLIALIQKPGHTYKITGDDCIDVLHDALENIADEDGAEITEIGLLVRQALADSHWLEVFAHEDDDGDNESTILNLPVESVCGRLIMAITERADALLPLLTERDSHEGLIAACLNQAEVITYG